MKVSIWSADGCRGLTLADHQNWITDKMDVLLPKDMGRMLDVQLYLGHESSRERRDYGKHERITKFFHRLDFPQLFETIVQQANGGRLLVSGSSNPLFRASADSLVSGSEDFRDASRREVRRHRQKDIVLHNADYQLQRRRMFWWPRHSMEGKV
jgi:hypothetical protein